jgi:hypothetical protein
MGFKMFERPYTNIENSLIAGTEFDKIMLYSYEGLNKLIGYSGLTEALFEMSV